MILGISDTEFTRDVTDDEEVIVSFWLSGVHKFELKRFINKKKNKIANLEQNIVMFMG